MKHFRLVSAALCASLAMAASVESQAQQAYPSRPVKLFVGYAAGGSADAQTRLVARFLEPRLKQPVVVENRVGAGGSIAANAVGQADPDGYTLIMTNGTLFSDVFMKQGVEIFKILTPVRQMVDNRLALITSAKLPVSSVQELIAYSKANPRKLNFGASAPNATFMMEILKQRTGIDYVNVQYKGVAAIVPAMITGELDLNIDSLGPYVAPAQNKTVRVLAVFQPRRVPSFPDVPTIEEAGVKGFEAAGISFGIWVPLNTPRPIVDRLTMELNAVAANAEFQQLANNIQMPLVATSSPDDYRRVTQAEYAFWKDAAKAAKYEPQ